MSNVMTISAEKKRARAISSIIYVFLTLLAIIYIVPLLWVLITSLKDDSTLMLSPWAMPAKLEWGNYEFAWTKGHLGTAMLNSLIVCSITLVVSMLFGSMAAFAIARLRWKLSKMAMYYFLIGMMIPIHTILIPLFVQFTDWSKWLKGHNIPIAMVNSLPGIIVPYITFSLPITIYIMVGFFEGIPNELFEAACIDGCSVYKMFGTVAIPLAKTGFMVTGLMSFVSNWNELLLAMVFISDETKKTLPVSLTKFVGPYHTNYCQMFAAILIAIVPTIIAYVAFANQIVEGLTAGAVKG